MLLETTRLLFGSKATGLEVFLAEWVDIDIRATVEGSPLWLLLEKPHRLDVLNIVRNIVRNMN